MISSTVNSYSVTKKSWMFAALILAAMLLQCLYFAWDNGQTVDETFYNGSGYPMVRYNHYRILGEHPPLMMQLGSLPLLFLQPRYPIDQPIYLGHSDGIDVSKMGSKFMYEMGNDAHLILFLERLAIIVVGMTLGIFIFLWAYELYGLPGALLSLTLFAFSPNIIAHSSLFTTDLGVAAFFFIAVYYLRRFFKMPSIHSLILTSLFAACALLSKMSAIILIPIILLLFGCFCVFENRTNFNIPSRKRFTFWLLVLSIFIFYMGIGQKIILVGLGPLCLVILKLYLIEDKPSRKWLNQFLHGLFWVGWLICFGFLTMLPQKRGMIFTLSAAFWNVLLLALSVLLAKRPKLLNYSYLIKCFAFIWLFASVLIILDYTDFYITIPKTRPFHHYIQAFNIATSHVFSNHKICVAGSFISCDWKYFFGVMSIKTPVVTLILFFLGLISFLRLKISAFNKLLVLVPPTIFIVSASFLNTINIGLRHVLPVYPFLFLIAGASIKLGESIKVRFVKLTTAVLLVGALLYFVISSALVVPNNLSYFNEFVRTPEKGVKLVGDSNLNWGQDNKRLAELMHSLRNPPIKIANSVNNVPEYNYYHLNWSYLPQEDYEHPKPGFYAMDLLNYVNQDDNPNSWFKGRQPTYIAGQVIYVFEVK